MTGNETRQLAAGYAWGTEDATGIRTATAPDQPDGSGDFAFANTYADAREAYNLSERGMCMPVQDAYRRWQETGGRTIESEADEQAAAAKQRPVTYIVLREIHPSSPPRKESP